MTSEILKILALIILIVAMPVGLTAIIFGFPGTWIILAASAIYAWFTDFAFITKQMLIGLLLLALLAELIDFMASSWGARRYGGSKKAMLGTLLGGIFGAIALTPVFFGLGSMLGAFLGAFAGAFFVTYLDLRKMDDAVRVGWGAFLGRVFATVFKGSIAVAMIAIDLWAVFFSNSV